MEGKWVKCTPVPDFKILYKQRSNVLYSLTLVAIIKSFDSIVNILECSYCLFVLYFAVIISEYIARVTKPNQKSNVMVKALFYKPEGRGFYNL
jgi:hypothetical protein